MTITFTIEQVIALILTAAALLGALAYLVRVGRKVHRRVMAAARLIDRELTNNHGSSMKDDVHGIAVAVGNLSREIDDLKSDFYHHLAERTPPTP